MSLSNRVAVIVSLWPSRLTARRASFSPMPDYIVPACVDITKPALLIVPQQTERPYMGLDRNATRTWEAHEVANDVVREMTSGLPGTNLEVGAEAAVWISEGAVLYNGAWVIPQAEIDLHRRKQDIVLKRLVETARGLHAEKAGNQILPIMHKAAEWLMVQGEPWQRDMTTEGHGKCPFCQSVVEKQNGELPPVCGTCRNIINRKAFDRVQDAEMEKTLTRRMENAIEGGDPADDENDLPPDEKLPEATGKTAVATNKGAKKGEPVTA